MSYFSTYMLGSSLSVNFPERDFWTARKAYNSLSRPQLRITRPQLSEELRPFDSRVYYRTVRVTVLVAVVLPEVPVTVTV